MIAPGPTLKEAREAAGLTQADLATRLGTTQSAVARLESAGANPRVDTFRRAIEATGNALQLRLEPSAYPPLDESLIVENLRKTPAERLRYFRSAYYDLRQLAPTVRARRGSEGQTSR